MIKKRIKKHHLTQSEELYYDIDLGECFTYTPGTVLTTGGIELHAIGTVIWNQELHRLEFWDGNVWQHLITSNIV